MHLLPLRYLRVRFLRTLSLQLSLSRFPPLCRALSPEEKDPISGQKWPQLPDWPPVAFWRGHDRLVERGGNNFNDDKDFRTENGSNQGPNWALTGLCVSSLRGARPSYGARRCNRSACALLRTCGCRAPFKAGLAQMGFVWVSRYLRSSKNTRPFRVCTCYQQYKLNGLDLVFPRCVHSYLIRIYMYIQILIYLLIHIYILI